MTFRPADSYDDFLFDEAWHELEDRLLWERDRVSELWSVPVENVTVDARERPLRGVYLDSSGVEE